MAPVPCTWPHPGDWTTSLVASSSCLGDLIVHLKNCLIMNHLILVLISCIPKFVGLSSRLNTFDTCTYYCSCSCSCCCCWWCCCCRCRCGCCCCCSCCSCCSCCFCCSCCSCFFVGFIGFIGFTNWSYCLIIILWLNNHHFAGWSRLHLRATPAGCSCDALGSSAIGGGL